MGFFSGITDAVGGFVGDIVGGLTGSTAAEASQQGAATTAAAQQAALDYYMQSNETAQGLMEGGLTQLGAISGFDPSGTYTGDFSAQQALIDQAKTSPFYQSQLNQGNEAIARAASATGGLRTGGTVGDLTGFEGNLLNQAYNQQLGGLQGLAQLPDTTAQTAQLIAAPGTTLGQGQIAAGQAVSTAYGNLLGGASQLGGAYLMSDRRMKENINKIDDTPHPDINLYEWDWRPESGKEGSEKGFIAQEVEKVWPDLVVTGKDGIKRIYKDQIQERLNGSFSG